MLIQHVNMSTFHHVDMSTYEHVNMPKCQHVNFQRIPHPSYDGALVSWLNPTFSSQTSLIFRGNQILSTTEQFIGGVLLHWNSDSQFQTQLQIFRHDYIYIDSWVGPLLINDDNNEWYFSFGGTTSWNGTLTSMVEWPNFTFPATTSGDLTLSFTISMKQIIEW